MVQGLVGFGLDDRWDWFSMDGRRSWFLMRGGEGVCCWNIVFLGFAFPSFIFPFFNLIL